jgi:hypothetical protein
MRKKTESVIRERRAALPPDGTSRFEPRPRAAATRPGRHRYTPHTTPPVFWSASEAPPETPWDARPGKALKPVRTRRVQVAWPGDRGTKRLVAQYGDRFVCLRYIYDAASGRRRRTIELLLEDEDWTPQKSGMHPDQLVGVRVDYDETALRQAVKGVGGRWDRVLQVWVLSHRDAVALDLAGRVTHAAPPGASALHASTPVANTVRATRQATPRPSDLRPRYTHKGGKSDE